MLKILLNIRYYKYKPIRNHPLWKIESEENILRVIIYDDSGHRYKLNPVASFVWMLLDGENTVDKIIDIVKNKYNISYYKAFIDIITLIIRFDKDGLIITDYNSLYPVRIYVSPKQQY